MPSPPAGLGSLTYEEAYTSWHLTISKPTLQSTSRVTCLCFKKSALLRHLYEYIWMDGGNMGIFIRQRAVGLPCIYVMIRHIIVSWQNVQTFGHSCWATPRKRIMKILLDISIQTIWCPSETRGFLFARVSGSIILEDSAPCDFVDLHIHPLYWCQVTIISKLKTISWEI